MQSLPPLPPPSGWPPLYGRSTPSKPRQVVIGNFPLTNHPIHPITHILGCFFGILYKSREPIAREKIQEMLRLIWLNITLEAAEQHNFFNSSQKWLILKIEPNSLLTKASRFGIEAMFSVYRKSLSPFLQLPKRLKKDLTLHCGIFIG